MFAVFHMKKYSHYFAFIRIIRDYLEYIIRRGGGNGRNMHTISETASIYNTTNG